MTNQPTTIAELAIYLGNWDKAIYDRQKESQTQLQEELKTMSAEFDALKTQVEAVLAQNKTLKDAATSDKAALADAAVDKQGMVALAAEATAALTPAAT
jgi:uncharacterized protein (DUF3084 family)